MCKSKLLYIPPAKYSETPVGPQTIFLKPTAITIYILPQIGLYFLKVLPTSQAVKIHITSPFGQVYFPSPCLNPFTNSPSYLAPSGHSWTPSPCRLSVPLWVLPWPSLCAPAPGTAPPRSGSAAAPLQVDSMLTGACISSTTFTWIQLRTKLVTLSERAITTLRELNFSCQESDLSFL